MVFGRRNKRIINNKKDKAIKFEAFVFSSYISISIYLFIIRDKITNQQIWANESKFIFIVDSIMATYVLLVTIILFIKICNKLKLTNYKQLK